MPKDKVLHIIVGCIIGFVGACFGSFLVGTGLACFAGLGKELSDKITGKGTPEVLDFLATCAGGVVGAGIGIVLKLIL